MSLGDCDLVCGVCFVRIVFSIVNDYNWVVLIDGRNLFIVCFGVYEDDLG